MATKTVEKKTKTKSDDKNQKGFDLIVTEKPKAALKIAQALADTKPTKESEFGTPVYYLTHKNQPILITSAVGHLYTLTEIERKKTLPVFDIEWVPTFEINKKNDYTKKYVKTLKQIAKLKPKRIIVATDYDIEGEVIGLNVIKYALKKNDASRMKFSTLTKKELVNSYENASPHLDWGQAKAGETRHMMDWYYGINLSRMLTRFLRDQNIWQQLSIGRVQGPALKVLVEKEKTISAFVARKYWQIFLNCQKENDDNIIESVNKNDKIFDEQKAKDIYQKVQNEKRGVVDTVKKKKITQLPPTPFDLTSLQIEAHNTLRIKPKQTLELAQELYINGYISYPRTASQKLPESINYKEILTNLKKNRNYAPLCDILFKKEKLKPNEGKKDDPAHPAIYPTGIAPEKVDGRALRLYDLIVKRFLATFGDNAIRESVNLKINVKNEIFVAKGVTTLIKGWHTLYEPYTSFKDQPLPLINEGDKLNIKKVEKIEKETLPPKRYNESSIIKELEKRNLGTKATRANIVETLQNRKYVDGSPLKATELGIKTVDVLEKFSPLIVDENLTRQFEQNLEEIREDKKTPQQILKNAQNTISNIIGDFKKHEKECSKELIEASSIARHEMSKVTICPVCKEGDAVMRKGKFGKFMACSNYPECKFTLNMPNNANNIKESKDECPSCHSKLVQFNANKRTVKICINPNCEINLEKAKIKKDPTKLDRKCPLCEHDLLIRDSFYGKFVACSNFPKCKYTEKLDPDGNPFSEPPVPIEEVKRRIEAKSKRKSSKKKKAVKKKTTKKKVTKKKTTKKKTTKKKTTKSK